MKQLRQLTLKHYELATEMGVQRYVGTSTPRGPWMTLYVPITLRTLFVDLLNEFPWRVVSQNETDQ